MIIGLYSPAPQSGKSEAALALTEYGFQRKSFAGILRSMVYNLLCDMGYTRLRAVELIMTGAGKATVIPELGVTVRYLMQTLGTEWGRETIRDDIWIRAVLNDNRPDLLVIDDVRFPNEFDAIRDEGGQVWRVYRPGAEPVNGHPSEGLLEGYDFDEEVVNDGDLSDLQHKVKAALLGP